MLSRRQGNELTRFFYGPDGARYKRIDQGNGSTTQTLYLGNVELILKNSTPQIRRYIAGVALMEIHPEQNTRTVKRLLHDHLGSVSLVVSNLNRSVLERYDYDAFGQRRAALGDPRGGWSWGPSSPRETNRGYTGHEMLDAFGAASSAVRSRPRGYRPWRATPGNRKERWASW